MHAVVCRFAVRAMLSVVSSAQHYYPTGYQVAMPHRKQKPLLTILHLAVAVSVSISLTLGVIYSEIPTTLLRERYSEWSIPTSVSALSKRASTQDLADASFSQCSDSQSRSQLQPHQISLPTYPQKGVCSLLAANKTASYLWNTNLERMLQLTVPQDNDDDLVWTRALAESILRPNRLRDGSKSRPLLSVWGRLLDKLSARMSLENNVKKSMQSPLQVLILGGATVHGVGSCVVPETLLASSRSTTSTKVASDSRQCAWPRLLQHIADQVLGVGVVQVTVRAVPMATTDLFTAALKHGLFSIAAVDVIVHAVSAADNYPTDRSNHTMDSVAYRDHQMRMHQDFIRAALQSRPCQSAAHQQQQPMVVFVDDWQDPSRQQSQQHEHWVADTLTLRVLQQLADYYPATAMISYPAAIQRLVMADPNSPLTNSASTNPQQRRQHPSKVVHTGVLWTILFAALDYTVQYCSRIQHAARDALTTQNTNSWLSATTRNRIETTLPPVLDGKSSLVTVSQEWQRDEEQLLARKAACRDKEQSASATPSTTVAADDNHACVLAFISDAAASISPTTASLKDHLAPVYKASTGWQVLATGTVRATEQSAHLTLQQQTVNAVRHVTVFVVRQDVHTVKSTPAQLRIQVKTGDTLVAQETVSVIHNTVPVALPVTLSVLPSLSAATTERNRTTLWTVELVLLQGESVDVEAIFVC